MCIVVTKRKMTELEHKTRHMKLHNMLDELVADFIDHTGEQPSKTTVLRLMTWSHVQTTLPSVE